MTFSLRTHAHSEIGLVRKNNQDSGYYSANMVLVADGMGGAAAGDLASTVAVESARDVDARLAGTEMLEMLAGALVKANDRIADLVAYNHELDGMGTTFTGAMFSGTQFGLVHIGDSRAYRLRDGALERLTRDHSWVQMLVEEGKITEEEAATHPHRSLLLKVLNGQPTHEPDLDLVDAELGDRLMFCSDGLCGLVDDADIERALRDEDPEQVLDELVAAAHAGGGSDNITILIADVVEQDAALDAVTPTTIGAAAAVDVPVVPEATINLGDELADERLDERGNPVPQAPAPAAGLPSGLIDPDAREKQRYTPTTDRRRRRVVPLIVSFAIVAGLLVGSFFGTRAYIAAQFYVGADSGDVAIFRGLPDRPLGIVLSSVEEASETRVADLPPYYADAVRANTLRPRSLDAARSTVSELTLKAERCIEQRRQGQELPPAPDPTSTESPSPTGTESPAPSVTVSAPSATESATPGVETPPSTPTQAYSSASPSQPTDDRDACS